MKKSPITRCTLEQLSNNWLDAPGRVQITSRIATERI
jgi:hypothetical protein